MNDLLIGDGAMEASGLGDIGPDFFASTAQNPREQVKASQVQLPIQDTARAFAFRLLRAKSHDFQQFLDFCQRLGLSLFYGHES